MKFCRDNIHINFRDENLWTYFCDIYVLGSAFYDQELLDSQKMAHFITSLNRNNEILSALNRFNGFFAFVYLTSDALYAAVDRVRSIPLFYCLKDGEFYISDNPHWIRTQIQSIEIDEVAAAEFMLTGYVTGRDTLYPDIKQLQAGEILVLDLNYGSLNLRTSQYYTYIPENYSSSSEEDNLKELNRIAVNIFQRLTKLASGRTIVVPLSGGYDSRLIVLMLKRLGYENVMAFSYGKPGNKESEISRKIAQILEIKWVFLPYSNEDWYKWYRSEEFKKYSCISCGLSSVPHIQDWPAVWMLKGRRLIPDNSLFVPGHGADILSGRVSNIAANSTLDPIETIFNQNYTLWRCSFDKYKKILKYKIARSFDKEPRSQDIVTLFECWRIQERHAKYIINSLRVYDFWGYSWWMPFWDKEFMDFWSRVPLEMKLDQRIYKKYVNNLFKNITNIKLKTNRDSRKYLLKMRARACLKKTPVFGITRDIHHNFKLHTDYKRHPLGWYGIIPKDKFIKYYTGNEHISSFIAADILERLSSDSKTAEEVFKKLVVARK